MEESMLSMLAITVMVAAAPVGPREQLLVDVNWL